MAADETVAYDEIADWYDQWVRRSLLHRELILPSMLALCGEVEGLEVVDIACGQGVLTRELARAGARAHGVDLSPRLIARAEGEGGAATYSIDDAQELRSLGDGSFDGATCSMGLTDIPDLALMAVAVHRVLRDGGWLVLALPHPCFQSPDAHWLHTETGTARAVEHYGREGRWASRDPGGVRGKVGAIHRTLSRIVGALIDAGFALDRVEEPLADGALADAVPGYREIPPLLVVRASRA